MQGVIGGVIAGQVVDPAGRRRRLVVRERAAGAADDVVAALVAGDRVVARAALEVVVASVALDRILAALAVGEVRPVVAEDDVRARGAVRQRGEVGDRRDVALAHHPADDAERVRIVQVVEDPGACGRQRALDHGVVARDGVAATVAEECVAAVEPAVGADPDGCCDRVGRLDAADHPVDPAGAAGDVVRAVVAVDHVAGERRPRPAVVAGRVGRVAGAVRVPLEEILVGAAGDAVVSALAVDRVVRGAAEQLVVAGRSRARR